MSNDIRHVLSAGLSSWLEFEKAAGRSGLFSEKYMALPIAQLLSHNMNGQVMAETNHPVLSGRGVRGRPPQLDFTINKDNKVVACVESKWIGASDVTIGDVIWDCVRLELAANKYGCDGIFLLAGKMGRLKEILFSDEFQSGNRRGTISPIMNIYGKGKWSINTQTTRHTYGQRLREYMSKYSDVDFPQSVVCGGGIQVNKDAERETFVAAVWIVRPERANPRFTFRAPPP
jgi:hypothetical protein